MTCVHLRQLYQLCQENDLKFSSSDLLHIVCRQCERQEVCPAVLTDEYDAKHPEVAAGETSHQDERDLGAG
jgi:hypothetical protein